MSLCFGTRKIYVRSPIQRPREPRRSPEKDGTCIERGCHSSGFPTPCPNEASSNPTPMRENLGLQ
ncbi:hypothetical protein [Anabaena azotica]|uniref:Uncharacterized protein n=1 Tax=Anabaena azotica FACHB-119 TaxID=947527 RepID=A0ABR8DFZ7_9NOST|nr:hypothetical protein [Anabaena azotica]MBD2505564.1 hypothetical protein [Anabaena azotica FACHB-119]